MLLQMKTFRQVGMKTVKTYPHRTSMTWTEITKMMINMRTFKELLNHMSKKKMVNKKFADAHRVSNHPTFPGARRWRRRRTGARRSRRRRMTSSRWRRGLSPCRRRTPPCHREPSLTRGVRGGLKEGRDF